MMNDFIKVANSSDLIENKGIVRRLDDDEIALVRLGGCVSAFINVCPHQHTPLVDKYGGQIVGENLTCPMHGWTFHLKTGKCVNVPPCGSAFQNPAISGTSTMAESKERDIPHSNNTSVMSEKSGKLRMLEVKVEDESVFVRRIIRSLTW